MSTHGDGRTRASTDVSLLSILIPNSFAYGSASYAFSWTVWKAANNFDGQLLIIDYFFHFFLTIYTINVFAWSKTIVINKLREKESYVLDLNNVHFLIRGSLAWNLQQGSYLLFIQSFCVSLSFEYLTRLGKMSRKFSADKRSKCSRRHEGDRWRNWPP